MKIFTVVGARPQFIKAAAVTRAIRELNARKNCRIHETYLHSGQHFDDNMSQIFFRELDIPEPAINLGISGLNHGAMTGRMIERMEEVFMQHTPDLILVYGDTNSTLAGALAAAKLHIPVAHVEAGVRSYNMRMPEEINRILTDRVSAFLFCPTKQAVANLRAEGIRTGVHLVGDVMYDAMLHYRAQALREKSLAPWGVDDYNYVIATIHRPENTDHENRLEAILMALQKIAEELPVILPLHPRTKPVLQQQSLQELVKNIAIVSPVSYLEMVRLETTARAVLTDSGGMQKEAFFNRVPCITLRDETEWPETVDSGWNVLCGADTGNILQAWNSLKRAPDRKNPKPYGSGKSATRIINTLLQTL